DVRESAIEDRGDGAAIVPGDVSKSLLLARVLSDDDDVRMPPPTSSKPRLTAEEIDLMRRWIDQGAEYEGHWAFLPVEIVKPPKARNKAWPRNAIDRFIAARLEEDKIVPAPEADRGTLIRRVYLDVLGLLPEPDEVAAFVEDTRDDAYERLVDRVLANPHHGERWARHWLDQARYADSNGYTIDSERAMWPFRDWVIRALNDDMPFDRFTIEQLAGDLLSEPTKQQLIATAFHRNTLINEEGGTDREQFRNEAVVDRVNTTAAVWMGLTLGCAQCHSHKFDPISQREYFQMFAFFNHGEDVNNRGPTVQVVRGELFGRPISPKTPVESAEAIAKRQAKWEPRELARLEEAEAATTKTEWKPAEYVEFETETGAGLQRLKDNSLLADGRGAFNDTYRVLANTQLPKVAAIRLRVLPHESLPRGGPGMAPTGNFVLTDFEVTLDGQELPIAEAFADIEQQKFPIAATIDDKPNTGWAVNLGSAAAWHTAHEAVFVLEKPVLTKGKPIQVRLLHDWKEQYTIGRFELAFSGDAPGLSEDDEKLLAALRMPANRRPPAEQGLVGRAFARSDTSAKKKPPISASDDVADVMVMRELSVPRETYVQLRGDFLRLDKEAGAVAPGVVAAVQSAFPDKSPKFATRLDLARWLVDPANPLTPRVTVNRMWMRYFGRGLVETDEDFGSQGSPPTHPELLDWLAHEFVRGGWSLKKMHRLIVTSATYRQSSQARPELTTIDPLNRLLARQNRVRVEGEIVRDAALVASGLLVREIGGPSVRPPQPEGVYAFTQNKKKWDAATGNDRYRRGLYTVFFRSAPYPLLTTFDSPDFQTTCTRRVRSNTPLQALTLANDPAFIEMARGLARRVVDEAPAGRAKPQAKENVRERVDERLRLAWTLCLSREPSTEQLDILRMYYERQRAAFDDDDTSAKEWIGNEFDASQVSAAEAAALVCVARTIMNTDAFITRE
ncbi:MAG TPA: PSD1 and planctomycete cytochrome C domain-containing protein, partial [Pirellulales bacterium]|nr:PSD1 and planctomycete cytochrome C domain-containing protein [Pirellulales bacterium]